MKRFVLLSLVAVFSLLVAVAAQAGMDMPVVIDNVPNIIAIAGGAAPDYLGSDDYKAAVGPFARFTFSGERYVQLLATEINVNVINHPVFRFGPSLNYRFGRKDVDDPVVSQMQELDGTIEAGAFVGLVFANPNNPRQRFITNLDFLADVGGKYKGYNVTLSARYWYPVMLPLDVSIGASTTYADSKYMNYYFGVNEGNVGSSGLPFYKPSDTIRDVTVSPAAVFHFSKQWHLGAGVRYQFLCSEANDSPVVAQRGSSSQWVYGLAVAYSW